jgi:hypothetical protein
MINTSRLYQSGMTTRYHTENPVMRQCVDAHSWGVAALIIACHGNPSAELLKAAILHDTAERRGPGDIRYQAKRDNPVLRVEAMQAELEEFDRLGVHLPGLSDKEEAWLEWADMAEVSAYCRCLWEDCGYRCAVVIWGEAMEVILERVKPLNPAAVQFTSELQADYERARNEISLA